MMLGKLSLLDLLISNTRRWLKRLHVRSIIRKLALLSSRINFIPSIGRKAIRSRQLKPVSSKGISSLSDIRNTSKGISSLSDIHNTSKGVSPLSATYKLRPLFGKAPLLSTSSASSDNRIFVYEVEGLRHNEHTMSNGYPIRNSSTTLVKVPYIRMNEEMRRITRLGGTIVGIYPLSEYLSKNKVRV